MDTMIEINVKHKESGFSLTELSMLLLMTAILLAISIPLLGSAMHSMQLVSDSRNIATTMTYAKVGATAQMTSYRMSFDLANNQWSLQKRNRSTGDYELQQAVNQLSSGVANSGIAFKNTSSHSSPSGFPSGSSTTITFNSRGLPSEGMSIIYISNSTDDYAVSVSLSGKVQVWRFRDSQWIPQ